MDIAAAFSAHLDGLAERYARSLADAGADAALLFSGRERFHYADDRGMPFQAFGHFLHWLPVNRPDQCVLVRPGSRPVYYRVVPDDYWYDQTIDIEPWWAERFEVVTLGSTADIARHPPPGDVVWLGEPADCAGALGIDGERINPPGLLRFLDFHRAVKSGYELEQLRAASEGAMAGHRAARRRFLEGGGEYDIHMAFLAACGSLEDEAPYTGIVALDEKAAILHYQHKRRGPAGDARTLLIDAGCRVRGYGADVTRTTVKDSAPGAFKDLLAGMDALQRELAAMCAPGKTGTELHMAALEGLARLLLELELCSGDAGRLLEDAVPQLFMPHGIGHLLGIQVHDVGGRQRDATGGEVEPPAHSPMLRNTRRMEPDMVLTVEPGCYFIPLLLEPERGSERGKLINWPLVDELYPCGGVRIEDNVRVAADGAPENLTRRHE